MTQKNMPVDADPYELHFRSLLPAGRSLSFPCDAEGRVPLDLLSDSARNDYLFARICVGRDFASPVVKPMAASKTQTAAASFMAAAQELLGQKLQMAV